MNKADVKRIARAVIRETTELEIKAEKRELKILQAKRGTLYVKSDPFGVTRALTEVYANRIRSPRLRIKALEARLDALEVKA